MKVHDAKNKRGLFEEADGGTAFLDEIADTTPAFRAKLLRVLPEGKVRGRKSKGSGVVSWQMAIKVPDPFLTAL